MMVGLPGSGKSTWIRDHFSTVVIGTDRIIDQLAADQIKTYDEVWADNIKAATKLMWSEFDFWLSTADEQTEICIDRTNLTEKSRREFLSKIPDGWHVKAIVLPKPKDWAWRLRQRPGKTIPQNVLDNMVKHYQEPLLSEGFNQIEWINNAA